LPITGLCVCACAVRFHGGLMAIGLFSQALPLQLTAYDTPCPPFRQYNWCLIGARTFWPSASVQG